MTDTTSLIDARITRLLDEHEITRTLYQWVQALDAGDYDRLMDCYSPDGTMEVFTHENTHVNEADFRRFLEMNVSHGAHLHLNTSPQIEVSGDSAKATSYIVRIDAVGDSGEPLLRAIGVYHDDLVRSVDGRWRIGFRFVERIAFTDAGVASDHPALARRA